MSGAAGAPARTALELAVAVQDLGLIPYDRALEVQRQVAEARAAGRGPDTLLLLEHPPVITLGRNARAGHVLASADELLRLGVSLRECDRGGDVTYHGPGQLVGWPVLLLPEGRRDVRRYVRDLEEAQIRTLGDFGIAAGREPGMTGVWVGRDKVGAIGVRLSRWLTSHGFALNVSTDLAHFSLITPCGIADRGVTSMARLIGRAPSMAEVKARLAAHFRAVFG